MFPTTIWTTIRRAGGDDPRALEAFARSYRAPVLGYLRRKGFDPTDVEDLCQETFLRLLRGNVLARADPERGRFRSLLLTVAQRVVLDRWRERSAPGLQELEPDRLPASPDTGASKQDPDFDREWFLELVERALRRLEQEGSPYHGVLRRHLSGVKQEKQKLWIARKKLSAGIRREVALTCSSPAELEAELAYLSTFLAPLRPGLRPENRKGLRPRRPPREAR